MANDRIYLRCKVCDEQKMLFKFYLAGEGYANDADTLTEWINEHLHERQFDLDLAGEAGFVLTTESVQTAPPERER